MPEAKHRKQKASAGRPKSPQAKDHWVSFRVTAGELFQIMAKAEASGVSHAEYARSRALRGIARRKKSAQLRLPDFDGDMRAMLHEARRQGVNLNQIAHHCNAFKVPPPREFDELLRKLNALWDRLLAQS